jgi:signal transduction histidine kinase
VTIEPPHTPLQAVRRPSFLLTAWPWRSLAYLLTSLPAMIGATMLALPLLALVQRTLTLHRADLGKLITLSMIALVLAVPAALAVRLVERRRLALVDRRPPTARPRPDLSAAAVGRSAGYLLLLGTVLPVAYTVVGILTLLIVTMAASPLLLAVNTERLAIGLTEIDTLSQTIPYCVAGLLLLPAIPYLLAALAGAQAATARALLTGGLEPQLQADLVEVASSRARLADAFDAERRRIERDLHDGAQQRLISLTLQLGLARLDLPPDSAATTHVTAAHEQAKQLMAELRRLIHGIRPQTLADLGLPAALQELAEQSAVPVAVDTAGLPVVPAGPAEHAAYFVVAEALTNVARHSRATAARVTAHQRGGVLTVEVHDDGRGGAAATEGSGLTGLADRVAAVGGRMLLSSPAGGPTVLRAEF